jgi:hypothetical protein
MTAFRPLLAILLLVALPAHAATVPAPPASVVSQIVSAACGDTLALDPAQAYPVGPTIARTTDCPNSAPLTIAANGATLDSWTFKAPRGLIIDRAHLVNHFNGVGYTTALAFTGGMGADGTPAWDCRGVKVTRARVEGPYLAETGKPYNGGEGLGVSFLHCADVEISGAYLTGFKVGGLFGQSKDIRFLGNECAMMSADCLNVGAGWGVRVEGNYCHFLHVTAVQHPDCYQLYPRSYFSTVKGAAGYCVPMPPTSDVVIRNNRAMVYSQAVFLGSHEYPDPCHPNADGTLPLLRDGGFRNVLIADNLLITGGGNAIGIGYTEGLTLKRNRVETLPSAFSYFNGGSLANINASNAGTPLARCGNVVLDGAGKRGSADPICPEDVPVLPPDTRDLQIATLGARTAQLGADLIAAQAAAAQALQDRDASAAAAAQAQADAAAARTAAEAAAARFLALLTGLTDLVAAQPH